MPFVTKNAFNGVSVGLLWLLQQGTPFNENKLLTSTTYDLSFILFESKKTKMIK